jgi:transcriptional regulator with XRE-family HTH domain
MDNQPLPFSDLLELLFEHRRKPDGSAYKAAEVVRASGVSASQISLLVNGQRQNTSVDTARALLQVFDVPLDILNARSKAEVIALLDTLPQRGDPAIRLRGALSRELSPRALRQIEQLIEYVLAREHALEAGQPEPPLPDLRTTQRIEAG